VPVDPRDYFRGDFVVLSYDVNRPPPEGIAGIPHRLLVVARWDRDAYLEDRTVYVTVEPDVDGRHWHAVKVQHRTPGNGKILCAELLAEQFPEPDPVGDRGYYVEEGKGKDWKQLRNKQNSRPKSPSPPGARPSSSSSLKSDERRSRVSFG